MRRTATVEANVVALVDRVWVCSALDRDRLRPLCSNRRSESIHVVPNGIPRPDALPKSLPPARHGGACWPRLLFCGNFGYSPNVEAAHRLAELMPSIWQRLPNACLVLAGRNPSPDVLAMSRSGRILVLPDPADIDAVLRDADIAVVPLLRGGGTRIKVLEAMGWGLPVVASSRAVEGLNLTSGIHFRLAETTQSFVSQIDLLGTDPKLFDSLRTAAREFALINYGPAAIDAAVKRGLQD